MSKKRRNIQEAVRGRYTPIPHELLDSRKFIGLSHIAKALLFDALRQHNGRNNGHIQLSEKWLKGRGWTSKDVIQRARKQLVESGLLSITKQGGNKWPTLFAFTWLDITEYNGLEIPFGQFMKGGWRDPAAPLVTRKIEAKNADAPTSENYKEHPASRGTPTPPHGGLNACCTPPHGAYMALSDTFSPPPDGDNETVASYPTLKSSSETVKNERKERAQKTHSR